MSEITAQAPSSPPTVVVPAAEMPKPVPDIRGKGRSK
jgi:hypothetical protein